MTSSTKAARAVVIGRFQPLHHGHMALLRRALEVAQELVVVLGSATSPRTAKNPFTAEERMAMILGSMGADAGRVRFALVRDYYDMGRWAAAVVAAVECHGPADSTRLVGHVKDVSSAYLAHFPGWELVPVDRLGPEDATPIRQLWYGGEDPARLPVPPAAASVMASIEVAPLAEEASYLETYRASWAAAPYPPTFVTVDTILECAGHILLIRRGGLPGKGQWALPGGFLDGGERLFAAALRELHEETGLDAAKAMLKATHVFDHPERSARGRTITHAFHFDLGVGSLPVAVAADDAADARWVAIAELPAMEREMFEDHYMILARFLEGLV